MSFRPQFDLDKYKDEENGLIKKITSLKTIQLKSYKSHQISYFVSQFPESLPSRPNAWNPSKGYPFRNSEWMGPRQNRIGLTEPISGHSFSGL
jgi:hypothetical protein